MLHNFWIFTFNVAVKLRGQKYKNLFFTCLSFSFQLQIYKPLVTHWKHKQKQGEMLHNFSIFIFNIAVKLRDDKNTKRIFYITIIFISIANLQTVSYTLKKWAKTRGNAAQFLNFHFCHHSGFPRTVIACELATLCSCKHAMTILA